jgi:hypothetical protein
MKILLLTAALLMGAAPAPPHEAGGVAVAISDGVSQVAEGDTLDYRVTLRNTHADTPATVRLELSLPVGVSGARVHDGGERVESWLAVWTPTVPANGTVTVSASFVAGKPHPAVKGYAAQACLVHENVRQACATDINQLPGRPDIHTMSPATAEDPGVGWLTWLMAVLVAAVLAIGGTWLLFRARAGRCSEHGRGFDRFRLG